MTLVTEPIQFLLLDQIDAGVETALGIGDVIAGWGVSRGRRLRTWVDNVGTGRLEKNDVASRTAASESIGTFRRVEVVGCDLPPMGGALTFCVHKATVRIATRSPDTAVSEPNGYI